MFSAGVSDLKLTHIDICVILAIHYFEHHLSASQTNEETKFQWTIWDIDWRLLWKEDFVSESILPHFCISKITNYWYPCSDVWKSLATANTSFHSSSSCK